MPKKKIFGNIKATVLIGYLILFALSIYGLIKIYQQIVELSESTIPTEVESKELNLVSNALVSMYEAESTRKIVFSGAMFTSDLKETYINTNNKVKVYIDSLYRNAKDSLMRSRLDTINLLLAKKDENIYEMYELMESINNLPYSKNISTTLLSREHVINLNELIKDRMITAKDTAYYVKKKKNFGERLKAVFRNDEDSIKVVSKKTVELNDSIKKILPVTLLTDTIAQYVNDLNKKSDKRKINYLVKLSARQNQILYYDELFTHQINSILRHIEKNEKEKLHNNLLKREVVLTESYQIVATIGLIALLVVLIFIIWSLTLINRSVQNRKKLEESNRYAEALLKSRERLLLMMSHDVKAPLSSILGHIELMSDSKLSEKDKKNLDNMRYSSEQILELSKKLMDFHQLEKGKSEVQLLIFNPYDLVNNVAKSYIPTTKKKNLYLKIENQIPKHLNCIADPQIIKQILNNLISNAVKFTNNGGITVKSIFNENNEELFISVKDTGIGISDTYKDEIFQDFSKATNYSQLNPVDIQGHGLGLAITQRLVKLIKGNIQVQSKLNVGTELLLFIPIEISSEKKIPPTEENHICEEVSPVIKNAKVIVVDDDVTVLQLYLGLANKLGVSLDTFSNPLKAIEHLKKVKYDIIFTDIQMPGINGFEFVRKIKELNNENSKLPIVALSARFDMQEEEYKNAGFDNFLIKPVAFNKLNEVMLKALQENTDNKVVEKQKTNSNNNVNGFESLITFVKDDKETSLDILNTFKSENEIKITEITQGLADGNWSVIESNAHKLLPLMRMVDDKKIVDLLETIEAGSKNKAEVEKLLPLLKGKNIELEHYITTNFN